MADWRLPFSQQESFSQRSRSRSPRGDTWWPPAPRDYDRFESVSWRMPERWSNEEPHDLYRGSQPTQFGQFEDSSEYAYRQPLESWSHERTYRSQFDGNRSDDYGYYGYDDSVNSSHNGRYDMYHSFSSRYHHSSRHGDDGGWYRDRHKMYSRRQPSREINIEVGNVVDDKSTDYNTSSSADVMEPVTERKVEQVKTPPPLSPPKLTEHSAPTPTSKYYCDICNVFTTSEDQLQGHYQGTKHLKMVNRVGTGRDTAATTTAAAASQEDSENCIMMKMCTVCGKHAKGDFNNDEHLSSERHQKWIEVFKKRNRNIASDASKMFKDVPMTEEEMDTVLKLEERPDGYHCSVCDVVMGNYSVYKQHVSGLKHQKVLRQKTGGEDNSKRHRCEVCGVDIQGERSLKAHLEGQKHRKSLARMAGKSDTLTEMVRELPSEKLIPPNGMYCAVCAVHCTSKIDFDNHENGKQHNRKLMEKKQKIKTERVND